MNHFKGYRPLIRIIGVIIFIVFPISTFAQKSNATAIKGKVTDNNGIPIEYATIYLKETQQSTQSDIKGNYKLIANLGEYTLCVQMIGYDNYEQKLNIKANLKDNINISLNEKRYALQEVVIQGRSAVMRINESPFNAVAIDAKIQHNSTANISGMLNKVWV